MTGDMSSTLSQNVRKSVNLSVSVLGQKSRCQVAVMTEQHTVSMHACVCVRVCVQVCVQVGQNKSERDGGSNSLHA